MPFKIILIIEVIIEKLIIMKLQIAYKFSEFCKEREIDVVLWANSWSNSRAKLLGYPIKHMDRHPSHTAQVILGP